MKPSILWLYSDWQQNDYRKDNDLYGGIGYYRAIKPAQALSEWFDIEVVGADIMHWGTTEETYDRFKHYDLIISKHARTAQEASNTLAAAKHFKKKILIDIDDNYTAIRPDNPAFQDYAYGQGPREFVSALMSLADGVIVSTNPLRKVYKEANKNIHVLPNCNDINDWPKEPKKWNDGKIRIGFAGGRGHMADLEIVLEPLSYVLAKYPNVLFEIVGAVTPQEAMMMGVKMNEFCKKDITSQFRIAGGTPAWQGYPERLAELGWDIVLAPLIDDAFNKSKSHIRWMESAMVKAPVIASPVYPYIEKIQGKNTIIHGETGLFANSSTEWLENMVDLVENEEKRKTIADNAYEYVKNNWQWSQWTDKWREVITKYL